MSFFSSADPPAEGLLPSLRRHRPQWVGTEAAGIPRSGNGRALRLTGQAKKDLKSYDFRSFSVEISGIEPLTS